MEAEIAAVRARIVATQKKVNEVNNFHPTTQVILKDLMGNLLGDDTSCDSIVYIGSLIDKHVKSLAYSSKLERIISEDK